MTRIARVAALRSAVLCLAVGVTPEQCDWCGMYAPKPELGWRKAEHRRGCLYARLCDAAEDAEKAL